MILFLLKDKGREGRIAAQKELSDAMHVSPATVAVSLKSLEREGYVEKLADEIGKNDSVRVVTSDALIQLTALRAGVLRMSAREFRQELAQVAQQLEAAIRDLNGR